jgi:hypothetical protein
LNSNVWTCDLCRAVCHFCSLFNKSPFVQLCDYWKRVPSCIFDSRALCESILKRIYSHANQRMRSQASQSLLTRSWSLCNPTTTASLFKQLTLDTFHLSADTTGKSSLSSLLALAYVSSSASAVSLEGERFMKDKQQHFKDLRIRGNRLVIYNQIIQPPRGITAEDTTLARLAFKLTDTDENR